MKILRLTENRYAWAALLAVPMLAGWAIVKIPPIGRVEADRREAARRADARRIELSPPGAVDTRPALLSLARQLAAKGFTPKVLEDKYRATSIQTLVMAASPANAPWLAKLDAAIGPELDRLAEIHAKAVLPEPTLSYETGSVASSYFAMHQWVAPLAVARAARGHWDGALRLLEAGMIRVGKPSDTFYTNEGMDTALILLRLKPPAEVCRRLSAMMRLARTTPGAWSRHGMGLGVRQMFGSPQPEFSRATITAISERLNSDGELIDRVNALSTTEPNAFQGIGWWGDNGQMYNDDGRVNVSRFRGTASGLMPWTSSYSDLRDARRLLAKHPELSGSLYGVSPAALAGLDPVATAAVYGGSWRLEERIAMANQTRISLTFLWLREIAFAARAYRLEKGKWPADLKTLVPEYLPDLPDPHLSSVKASEAAKVFLADNFATSRQPLGPFRCGAVPVTGNNVAEWLPLPARNKFSFTYPGELSVLDSLVCLTSGTETGVGSTWTAAVQAYAGNGASFRVAALIGRLMPDDAMTSVVVWGTNKISSDHGTSTASMMMTTAELAAAPVVDDQRETGTLEMTLERLTRNGTTRAHEWRAFLDSVRYPHTMVNLQFRTPTTAFAVWSPGNNGLDEGGLEPEHYVEKHGGPRVAGDILLFVPE